MNFLLICFQQFTWNSTWTEFEFLPVINASLLQHKASDRPIIFARHWKRTSLLPFALWSRPKEQSTCLHQWISVSEMRYGDHWGQTYSQPLTIEKRSHLPPQVRPPLRADCLNYSSGALTVDPCRGNRQSSFLSFGLRRVSRLHSSLPHSSHKWEMAPQDLAPVLFLIGCHRWDTNCQRVT